MESSSELCVSRALTGELIANFALEEFQGKAVRFLKNRLAKEIGIPRFRQRLVGEDGRKLEDDDLIYASNLQLVILNSCFTSQARDKLMSACSRAAHVEEVEALLQEPIAPDGKEQENSALHVASMAGHEQTVALLLEAKAMVDKETAFPMVETALHLACGNGHPEIVKLLLEAHADTETWLSSVMCAPFWPYIIHLAGNICFFF